MWLSANRSSFPASTSPRFHTSARLASMSGTRNRAPDPVNGFPAMHTANRFPRRSYTLDSPSWTPSIRRCASHSGMNFCSSSGEVCWMSSRYSRVLFPSASAKLIFSTSRRAAASGAAAGSSDVVAVPSAGPSTLTNTRPSRAATYSSSVVLP
ncbi:hypothetical protein SRB5_67000 [Streptomyces sp. RB5]|uniref:Uncharacterized protein n=1 Tax=Streptomyces smaragdinus TaxID=2585196 RepID=A0A7K0CSS3_9ACTN|nr:hypothetical protein [Streptomyces smaragdinus]